MTDFPPPISLSLSIVYVWHWCALFILLIKQKTNYCLIFNCYHTIICVFVAPYVYRILLSFPLSLSLSASLVPLFSLCHSFLLDSPLGLIMHALSSMHVISMRVSNFESVGNEREREEKKTNWKLPPLAPAATPLYATWQLMYKYVCECEASASASIYEYSLSLWSVSSVCTLLAYLTTTKLLYLFFFVFLFFVRRLCLTFALLRWHF